MDNVPTPPVRRRRQNPIPEPFILDPPSRPPIADSPGSSGRPGPPQEPTLQSPISATLSFAACPDLPARLRPSQEPSPQLPISATTVAATATAFRGSPGLQPPWNPIPQTPTAASNPVTLLIEDWLGCRPLFSPGSSKIVAIISDNFSLRDLPLLEGLMKGESERPQELQGFVIGNPEIIPELRKKRESYLAMLQAGPKGCHQPPHVSIPQPPISVVPAAALRGPPGLRGPPQAPTPQPGIFAIPAASPGIPTLRPPPDLMPLSPTTPSDQQTLLIKDQADCRDLALPRIAKVVAVISPKFPLDQLPFLEATIATESKKAQEFQNFVVGNPEIIPELRKEREILLATARSIDVKIAACHRLVRRMDEMKAIIRSVGCNSLEGIDRQINLVASTGIELRQARGELQRLYRI